MQLNWTPDDQPASDHNSGRSTFVYRLEQQLGLKFVPAMAAASLVVIDHAEQPTDN